MQIFSEFYTEHVPLIQPPSPRYAEIQDYKDYEARREDQCVSLTRLKLCTDENGPLPANREMWTPDQKKKLNNSLKEFIAHRKTLHTKKQSSPQMLSCDIACIIRGIRNIWGFEIDKYRGSIFNDRKSRVMCALKNKIRRIQASGFLRKFHNTL